MATGTYICSYCGKEFQRKVSEIRTETPCCSRSCAARLRRWGQWPKRKALPNATCPVCGKEFRRPPSHLERVKIPVCSRQCNGFFRGQEWAKHAHKARAAWSVKAERAFKKRMTGPNNPAWKGGKITRRHYIYVRCPLALVSMSRKDGYVLEHRLVMAQHLKRPLIRQEVVHHIDGDCKNNALENLRLYASNGEHLSDSLAKENPESPWHS